MRLSSLYWVSSWGGDNTTPLATTDFHQFVQQNLVILVDDNISLVGTELLCLLAVYSGSAHLSCDLLGFCDSLVCSSNLRHLFGVLIHLVVTEKFECC